MKKTKLILMFAMVIFAMAFFDLAQAQENPEITEDFLPSKAIAVATVNIYDAQIVSQENNKIKISFDLSNRVNIQPDIKYSVQLVKEENQIQSMMDEKIYPEVVTLNENQTIKKEIEYLAPEYLAGEFQIWLIAKNQNGLTLAMVNPGKVTLKGDNQYIEIDAGSCYLRVEGEPEDKIYDLVQGVDIKSDEKLIATCDIINHAKSAIIFTPQIKTYWRTTFGPEVKDNQEVQPTLTLESQQKKSLYFTLPKADVPQAYDAVMQIKNDQGLLISNQATFHYVLRGLSATIQNLRLDKDYYQKGDTAKVSFFWTASADNFPQSRLGETENSQMQISIIIKNSQNQICASTQKELNQNVSTVDYNLLINSDCQNPNIAVSIQDDKGNVLDKKDFNIESQNVPIVQKQQQDPPQSEQLDVLKYGVIFLVVLLIISLVIILVVKKRSGMLMILFGILAGGMLLFGGEAKADTFNVAGHNTYTVSLNKANYSPGENVVVSGTGAWSWCSNTWGNMALKARVNSTERQLFLTGASRVRCTYGQPGCSCGRAGCFGKSTASGSASISAQSAGGTYRADIAGCDGFENSCASYGYNYSIPYTVISPAVNGACGSSDGGNFSSAPTSGLCNAGTASAVSGTGPWNWTCNGSGGGSNASCSAKKSCTLPWGGSINSGNTVTAYQSSSVACGSTCASVSQSRTCTNGVLSGTYTEQACSVQVCPPVPTLTFSATPNPIEKGQSTTLSWATTDTQSCWGSGGDWDGWKTSTGGTQAVSPTISTTYSLECWNSGGTSTGIKSVSINVTCTPNYSYACSQLSTGNTCIGNCGQTIVTATGTCTGFDNNSCGLLAPLFSKQDCIDNGVACSDTTEVCPECGVDTGVWQEVAP